MTLRWALLIILTVALLGSMSVNVHAESLQPSSGSESSSNSYFRPLTRTEEGLLLGSVLLAGGAVFYPSEMITGFLTVGSAIASCWERDDLLSCIEPTEHVERRMVIDPADDSYIMVERPLTSIATRAGGRSALLNQILGEEDASLEVRINDEGKVILSNPSSLESWVNVYLPTERQAAHANIMQDMVAAFPKNQNLQAEFDQAFPQEKALTVGDIKSFYERQRDLTVIREAVFSSVRIEKVDVERVFPKETERILRRQIELIDIRLKDQSMEKTNKLFFLLLRDQNQEALSALQEEEGGSQGEVLQRDFQSIQTAVKAAMPPTVGGYALLGTDKVSTQIFRLFNYFQGTQKLQEQTLEQTQGELIQWAKLRSSFLTTYIGENQAKGNE